MTDRELLELAAKAAGISVKYNEASGLFWLGDKFTGLWWDPLTNDGDALRLAVKLGLDLYIDDESFDERYTQASNASGCAKATERHSPDPYAATRRAIVRAAAEIGKELK